MNETTVTDLLTGIEDVCLLTDECLEATVTELIDRCGETEYCAESTANATNPATGTPTDCDDMKEIKFEFSVTPIPPTEPPTQEPSPEPSPAPTPAPSSPPTAQSGSPTPAPSPEPSPAPSPEPSPAPSPAPSPEPSPAPSSPPSPAPTGSCDIDVNIDGCLNISLVQDNNCEGRPVQITFRYNGGDCSQSDNLQDRQKFDCFDIEPPVGVGPPPTVAGEEAYIVATQFGGGSVYFEGFVPVGETFTHNKVNIIWTTSMGNLD